MLDPLSKIKRKKRDFVFSNSSEKERFEQQQKTYLRYSFVLVLYIYYVLYCVLHKKHWHTMNVDQLWFLASENHFLFSLSRSSLSVLLHSHLLCLLPMQNIVHRSYNVCYTQYSPFICIFVERDDEKEKKQAEQKPCICKISNDTKWKYM